MKRIATRRIILILLVFITWVTFNFASESWELLFNEKSVDGETIINLKIVSDVDLEDIKEIVHQASQQKVQRIEINVEAAGDEDAIVRTIFMDTNSRQALITRLQNKYAKDVIVLSAVSIGGRVSLEIRYKILATLVIAVISIFILLVLYARAIKNGKAVN
jgi:preprotein translocase subunit SecF